MDCTSQALTEAVGRWRKGALSSEGIGRNKAAGMRWQGSMDTAKLT